MTYLDHTKKKFISGYLISGKKLIILMKDNEGSIMSEIEIFKERFKGERDFVVQECFALELQEDNMYAVLREDTVSIGRLNNRNTVEEIKNLLSKFKELR
jgi:hypothetical protein